MTAATTASVSTTIGDANNASPSHRFPQLCPQWEGRRQIEHQLFDRCRRSDQLVKRVIRIDLSLSTQPFTSHTNLLPPALVESYQGVSRDLNEAQYFANVANVDAAVGKLLAGLEKLDRRKNTLIVFTSDNGPETLKLYRGAERSYGSPGPLRGMKLHTTDAGIRVAGIMNWPGKIAASGTSVSTPVSALDLFPTFCALANATVPEGLVLDAASRPRWKAERLCGETFDLDLLQCNQSNACSDAAWQLKVLARLDGGKLPKMTNVTSKNREPAEAKITDVEIMTSKDVRIKKCC